MIEPNSLISRLMTFVLASALVLLIILITTLFKLFPLERTQVLFLSSEPSAGRVIAIQKFDINNENLSIYKENFLKEYMVKRNQIIPDNATMRNIWRADSGGIVYNYSSTDVYKKFMATDFWHAIMIGRFEPLTFKCDVSFDKIVLRRRRPEFETYAITFRWICSNENDTRQTASKDFTIAVSLAFQSNLDWNERLDNPLGLKVVGYEVESGGNDPLNIF